MLLICTLQKSLYIMRIVYLSMHQTLLSVVLNILHILYCLPAVHMSMRLTLNRPRFQQAHSNNFKHDSPVLSALQKKPWHDAETLGKLLKHGCKMPDPAEVNVTDPRLLAWLHEPQLLQRDEKEIEGYTLQVSPCFGPLPQQLLSVCPKLSISLYFSTALSFT